MNDLNKTYASASLNAIAYAVTAVEHLPDLFAKNAVFVVVLKTIRQKRLVITPGLAGGLI